MWGASAHPPHRLLPRLSSLSVQGVGNMGGFSSTGLSWLLRRAAWHLRHHRPGLRRWGLALRVLDQRHGEAGCLGLPPEGRSPQPGASGLGPVWGLRVGAAPLAAPRGGSIRSSSCTERRLLVRCSQCHAPGRAAVLWGRIPGPAGDARATRERSRCPAVGQTRAAARV